MTHEAIDPTSDEALARVGTTLNRKWRVDALLDTGGMGAVYVATHRNGRRAAIKMLHARFALDPEVRRRFAREGYVANKIEHPGAVAILDDDTTDDGVPYLVMELLEGESLSTWLTRVGGRLSVGEVLAIAGQVVEVLAVAHDAQVVHRDIKPGNVFVTKGGYAKLLDFGLARVRDGGASNVRTAQGVVMGTAGYMAPEQARGKTDEVDHRTDLFAVGAVMFRALTGRRIHEKLTAIDTTIAAMKDPAPPLASAMPGAGPMLAKAVDKALAFDKRQRWDSARAMFDALRAAFEETRQGVPALPPERESTPSTLRVDVPISIEESSLVVDVAFGESHDEAIAKERVRTREVIDGLSTLSVLVVDDASKKT